MPLTIDGEDWCLDDLANVEDCNEAETYLREAICNIESQLENPVNLDPNWPRRARHALKCKQTLLTLVERRRGEFRRTLREQQSKEFNHRFVSIVRGTHPDIYEEVAGLI